MTIIYAWPPVAAVARLWTRRDPVSQSVGFFDDAVRSSQTAPTRRIAALTVSGRGPDDMGAAYMESLKRLLAGGQNHVRLYARPVHWRGLVGGLPLARDSGFDWTIEGDDLEFQTDAVPLSWYLTTPIAATATTLNGMPALALSDLPPNRLIAAPMEQVTLVREGEADQVTHLVAPVRSDASGAATVPVFDTLTGTGLLRIGTRESAVFRVDGVFPEPMQPDWGDWFYDLRFREVLPDEYAGATEVNPWQ